MTWLLVIGGIMLLVVLHELGHFAAAKAVGMRVEKLSLFFGPMLVKFRRGETTYGIGPIPAGGYVKITGMSPREELAPEVLPRAYYNQPVWKRIVVILAGPAVNLAIAFVLLWGLFAVNGVGKPSVGPVNPGSPAATVLRPHDRVLAVDGVTDPTVPQVSTLIGSHRCPGVPRAGCRASTPVKITLLRHGRQLEVRATPLYDAGRHRTRLGFAIDQAQVGVGVAGAAGESVSTLWSATTQTVSKFVEVFFSSAARKDVHSIVGGAEVARQSFDLSFSGGLGVLALISLTLAVVNLFPFLPLDGGHVFWALAEKIRGRRIAFATMEKTGVIGFVLILFIFGVGLTNDISTLTGNGFQLPR